MLFAIALLIALTVVAAGVLLAPQFAESRVVFADAPDPPAAFGYKMAWLAIRTRDTAAVEQALCVAASVPCNWDCGIGTVYDDRLGASHIFISPPVNGWTFVVGLALPHPVGPAFVDRCTPLLADLGGRFGEVQYYFSYPPIDLYAWAKLTDGRLVRGFAASDEGVIWNRGRITREERALGLKLFELRGVKGRRGDAGGEMILHPTEDHVIRLAQRWSLDPTQLQVIGSAPALGRIVLAPDSWRMERVCKRA